MNYKEINHEIGNIDLDLLDQVLKGRIDQTMEILDAGCGEGRNLHFFIKNNYKISAIDQNPAAINMLKMVSRSINSSYETDQFQTGDVTNLPYGNFSFDVVISNDVLHFAKNEIQFWQMFHEMIRVLKPEGLAYLKMKTTLQESENIPGHYEYFLLTNNLIQQIKEQERITILEPVKKTVITEIDCYCVLVLKC